MCGVPVHAADEYLQKLISQGFRVAVCEQTEDPAEAKKRGAKSVVRRDVVRLVTPGTLTEDELLDARRNNYLMAVALALRRRRGLCGRLGRHIDRPVPSPRRPACRRSPPTSRALSPSEVIVADNILNDPGHARDMGRARPGADAAAGEPLRQFGRGRTVSSSISASQALEGFGDFSRAEKAACGAHCSTMWRRPRSATCRRCARPCARPAARRC